MSIAHFHYLIVPKMVSERAQYLPVGFMQADMLAGEHVMIVREAGLYHFGVLSSAMHMAWVKFVTERLEPRTRNAEKAVFKAFPWPINHTQAQLRAIEVQAQEVLNVRAQFPNRTLAELYDPRTMPYALFEAHLALDEVVDSAYRPRHFHTEESRIEFLMGLHRQITSLLAMQEEADPVDQMPVPAESLRQPAKVAVKW